MKVPKALRKRSAYASLLTATAMIVLFAGCRSDNLLNPAERPGGVILPPDEEITDIGDFYYKDYDVMVRDITNQIAKRMRQIKVKEDRTPTIIIGNIKNQTPFNIDTREFSNDIADGLIEMGLANVYVTIPDNKNYKTDLYVLGGNIQQKDKVIGNIRERAFRLRLRLINYDDVDGDEDDTGKLILSKKVTILKRAWLGKGKDK